MARIDYYQDPSAPDPNSLVVAASAVVPDKHGRILMHRRRDNGLWALPGGGMEYGESIGGCVVREVEEETGYIVRPLDIIGVYSDPNHVFAYDDGEVRQEFSVCIACEVVAGHLSVSDESIEVEWLAPNELDSIDVHPRIRVRINDYLSGSRAVVS